MLRAGNAKQLGAHDADIVGRLDTDFHPPRACFNDGDHDVVPDLDHL